MSKLFTATRTMAGAARIAAQRGQSLPMAIAAPKLEHAPQRTQSNVIRIRWPTVVREMRHMPKPAEFSRAKHMAFLAGLHIATQTPIKVLIERIAAWHGMTYADIMSKTRRRAYVNARDDAIAAVKALKPKDGSRLSYSLPMVGRIFGGMDHTTVLASLRRSAKRGQA